VNLHQDKSLFQQAIVATAEHFKIAEIYIEKDYWVTVALYEIFHSSFAKEAVFKGGTALSKCHKLIERFSEDIDIVILRKEGETDNQLKNKLKTITALVHKVIPEVETELTNKKGQIRKTVHEYQKAGAKGILGQVREHIILEVSWLGSHEPFTQEKVSCYIADFMKANGQDELIKKYNLESFNVQVLSKERTFCEKIMSLVRFSWTQNPYYDLRNKIRHVYDIHMMLKDKAVKSVFESEEFDKMLVQIGRDDTVSYKNNNAWLHHHPSEALIFKNYKTAWDEIKSTYTTTFKDLVTGQLPDESEILKTLKLVGENLKKIEWNLK